MLLFLNSHVVWTLLPVAVSMARIVARGVRQRVQHRSKTSADDFASDVRLRQERVRSIDQTIPRRRKP